MACSHDFFDSVKRVVAKIVLSMLVQSGSLFLGLAAAWFALAYLVPIFVRLFSGSLHGASLAILRSYPDLLFLLWGFVCRASLSSVPSPCFVRVLYRSCGIIHYTISTFTKRLTPTFLWTCMSHFLGKLLLLQLQMPPSARKIVLESLKKLSGFGLDP